MAWIESEDELPEGEFFDFLGEGWFEGAAEAVRGLAGERSNPVAVFSVTIPESLFDKSNSSGVLRYISL